MAAIVHPGSAN